MKAILISKGDQSYDAKIRDMPEADLPEGNVNIKIDFSTLNYKDSLAISGKSPVVRNFPMIPGIDFSGTVETSTHPEYKSGDKVILNGWGVGEVHWGGLAQKARVNGDWLIPLPDAFTPRQAMAIGTAGYTAMLCVLALEHNGVTPDMGEIIVTGASGGVGSIAISILAKLGFTVVASTGSPDEQAEYLKFLGAHEIIDRQTLSEPGRVLGKERWAGAVDAVGSHTLANICATMKYGGVVTACGLAQGFDLPATVMPFILRGVTLQGIDSVNCPKKNRIEAWTRLGQDLNPDHIDKMVTEISLNEAIEVASQQLEGKIQGRVVVDVNR